MATLEGIEQRVTEFTQPGFRDRLLSRGSARSMIWRDGELPENAPVFSNLLSYDLLSYGYALLSDGLDIIEQQGNPEIARIAFENSADALSSVIANGAASETRDFHRFIAAAAYHLARYSARAYSLITSRLADANLTQSEKCLCFLMVRELDGLDSLIRSHKESGDSTDQAILDKLAALVEAGSEDSETDDQSLIDIVDDALTDNFMSALAFALLAFERGDKNLIEEAQARLRTGMDGSSELNLVPQWWCHRIAMFLIGDLWESSFHSKLSPLLTSEIDNNWESLRELFISSHLCRSKAEIELWPSQIEASTRAIDLTDNMVVSLPTSAGKTRIAELCILACLAIGKRVVFITPLRALSAQTEVGLDRTFSPLGKSVSSLYGSIGSSGIDSDFLRESDIIVATPEKLDFALRNDPSLLDDVGLVVLDEGHMIGLTEREVRYEVQIQKLLRRADANERRIVCLSAILPDGDKLEDFVGWLTNDSDEGLVQKDWRPTKLRFGEVAWRGDSAQLQFSVGEERPFVPRYIVPSLPPIGQRRTLFPKNQKELCLALAWRLVDDGQSVLIFCPLRKSVEPFAKDIVDLHKRGALPSVLEADPDVLDSALTIGREWFPEDHPILVCLKLGIAVHHGALPTPFRREIERLLRDGILKITISSPTLAQGLNLSATALIFHGLHRNGEIIKSSEFRNVVGRAGRAFVDVQGLVVLPMFNDVQKRRRNWEALIADDGGKEMESGLLQLVRYLLARMIKKHGIKNLKQLTEYVANMAYWEFPVLPDEDEEERETEQRRWNGYIALLDTAVFGMLGDEDIADEDIESKLDEVLQSSLWNRRIEKQPGENVEKILKIGLSGRTKALWSSTNTLQRRAYFFAGVGLRTGNILDEKAEALNDLLIKANGAILNDDEDVAIEAITAFAEIVFEIDPFIPDDFPADWVLLLKAWLNGETIVGIAEDDESASLKFIESALIYKLPWAMEAVRVRGLAHDDTIDEMFSMSDFELGYAVAAVETGTLNRPAAILMKSGFASRQAAIKAVNDGNGTFASLGELRLWLKSLEVSALSQQANWPTTQTHDMWVAFLDGFHVGRNRKWEKCHEEIAVNWFDDDAPVAGTPLRLSSDGDYTNILSADYEVLGRTDDAIEPDYKGLVRASVSEGLESVIVTAFGPSRLFH